MKRLVTIVAIAILLVGLVLLGISDTRIAVADASITDDQLTNSISKVSNSSGRCCNYYYNDWST